MAYATTTDLDELGLPTGWLTGVTTAQQEAALDAASAEADDYLRARYTLPLSAYPDSLKARVVDMAVFRLMKRRGYNPENGNDNLIAKAYDDAMVWLKQVARGEVVLGATDATPSTYEGAPEVNTGTARGW